MEPMAGKKLELGPIGDVVAKNVTRYREAARFNYTELSNELSKHKRDISALGVRRIEEGNRRVDVDDLAALALALDVSPLALLLPRSDSPIVPGGKIVEAERIWSWAQGASPLSGNLHTPSGLAFMINSNPFADWAEVLNLPSDIGQDFNSAMRQALSQGVISADGIDLSDENFSLNFRSVPSKDNHGHD